MRAGQSHDFAYTGGEQSWTLYPHCSYQLEVWGAQGGGPSGYRGGYGGYATGITSPNTYSTLYINVGGAGQGSDDREATLTGGYNGGGNVVPWPVNHVYGSGGGATHIATVTGVLSSLSGYKSTAGDHSSNEILIVAGGGGGGRNQANHADSARWGEGGSGGGYIGGRLTSSFGSTTSLSAHDDRAGTQTAGYAFGTGEIGQGNGAGGGGWFGGCNGA